VRPALFVPLASRENFEQRLDQGYAFLENFDSAWPMGSVANDECTSLVECVLFGVWPRVKDQVARRIEWLERALNDGEQLGPSRSFYRRKLLCALGICRWLHEADSAIDTWRQALDEHEAALFEPGTYTTTQVTYGLDDYMLLSLLSNQPARGVAMYERLRPDKPPLPLRSLRAPRDWGWWACRRRLGEVLDQTALRAAGRRVLRLNLDDPWLGRGQAIRAAMWLMAIYWLDERSLTPVQTLLRAYDDLPKVQRPDFAKAPQ
jgi:hypothetical protein